MEQVITPIKIKFYGTRGSIPVCDKEFQEFGGNTTCIQVKGKKEGSIGIIDAGTGIRKLGIDLIQSGGPLPSEVLIGFTHFHWDHIQGFPFFDLAYNPNVHLSLIALGEGRGIKDLKQIFEMQMQSEYFPVPLDKMGAHFKFQLPNKTKDLFNFTDVTAIRHNHPGGAYTYCLEQDEKKIVISTDIEHGDQLDPNILSLAENADLLIHDAQYTSEELKSHRGWGHSSYNQALEVAERANVKQLIMTHHDPAHNDHFLEKMEKYCQKRFSNCYLAREGMEITI